MAITLFMTKHRNTLVAEWGASVELLDKIKNGKEVKAVVTVPRSIRQHRLLFALLGKCMDAQREPAVYCESEDLLKDIKIGTGHYRTRVNYSGSVIVEPLSISFANLDQVKFNEWLEKAITFIVNNIVIGINENDLRREIYNMIGERQPEEINR